MSEAAYRRRKMNEMMRAAERVDGIPVPFFCECSDEDCTRPVWLTGAEYDRGRTSATWRPLRPGHGPDDVGSAVVVT